jgi:putative transposase
LLDEKRYLCSERTMYRILAANQEVRERRDQLRHPPYVAPQLLATRPNQLWSWDITKLLGPAKWTYFYLYVILDVFSRYVVGWMVAHRESAILAHKLIGETCARQGIVPGELTLHADRGSSMTSKPVAFLLADLGVTKTHSRPHVSDDNPFSEAQFKTLKYRPDFPDRFGCILDARGFCRAFFPWYNTEHHHSGIGLLTPEDVHLGRAAKRVTARADVLAAAYAAHPERFVHGAPQPAAAPTAVWINPPKPLLATDTQDTDRRGSSQIDASVLVQGSGTPKNGDELVVNPSIHGSTLVANQLLFDFPPGNQLNIFFLYQFLTSFTRKKIKILLPPIGPISGRRSGHRLHLIIAVCCMQ